MVWSTFLDTPRSVPSGGLLCSWEQTHARVALETEHAFLGSCLREFPGSIFRPTPPGMPLARMASPDFLGSLLTRSRPAVTYIYLDATGDLSRRVPLGGVVSLAGWWRAVTSAFQEFWLLLVNMPLAGCGRADVSETLETQMKMTQIDLEPDGSRSDETNGRPPLEPLQPACPPDPIKQGCRGFGDFFGQSELTKSGIWSLGDFS